MFYHKEMQFLQQSLKKMGLQTLIIDPYEPLDPRINLGLGKLLGNEEFYRHAFYDLHPELEPATIYRLRDDFSCQYQFFLLPDTEQPQVMMIGPYLTKEMSRQQFLEQAEHSAINPRQIRHLEKYYSMVPYVPEYNHAFVFLETFYDLLWDSYSFLEESDQINHALSPITTFNAPIHLEKTNWNVDFIEERYASENDLLNAVTSGQPHKADLILAAFSSMPFEKRADDPVRNLKNYCIIMNTLLRKAAEQGGVHPVYLDSASSNFAHKIEAHTSTASLESLMKEMFLTYCRLVQNHNIMPYSKPVQHVILHIDEDLGADLRLQTLAKMENLSPGYLSTLFHKETGTTLVEFINQRRVSMAKHLLTTTKLQIQTIAQHCGIMDVHYFTKVFKKHTGKTPKAYREG